MSDHAPQGKRRLRAVARFVMRHTVEAIALVLAAAVVVTGVAAWRLAQGPISLEFARGNFEDALARAFDGDAVALGAAQLEWSRADRALVLALTDVSVSDADGLEVARAPRLEAAVRLAGFARGRVEFARLVADGGAFSLVRRADGALFAGLGGPDSGLARRIDGAGAAADAPEDAETVTRDLRRRAALAVGGLSEFRVENAQLFVRDEITGLDWRAEDAVITLTPSDDGVEARATCEILAGGAGGARAPLEIVMRASSDFSQVLTRFSLDDARPSALFPHQGPLSLLAAVDAPVRLEGSLALSASSGVLAGDFLLDAQAGVLHVGDREEALRSARVRLAYEPASAAVVIEDAAFDVGASRGTVRGRLDAVGAIVDGRPAPEIPFELEVENLVVDATPAFERPIEIDAALARGIARPETLSARFDELRVSVIGVEADLRGALRFEQASDGRTLPAVRLRGPIVGEADQADILALWPVELADGARDWLARSLHAGRISNAHVDLDLPSEALVERRLADDRLTLTFDFADADVSVVSTMSPITDAEGEAVLYGNSFALDMTRGRMRGLDLTEGRVRIPRLNPKGAIATYSVVAHGAAREVIAFIDEPPLEYPSSFGVDPADIGGAGQVSITINRPMRVEVDPDDITFEVEGLYDGVTGPAIIEGLALSDARMTITASQAGLRASGRGRLGPIAAEIDWREDFDNPDRARSTSFDVRASVDSTTLDRLGAPARAVMQGVTELRVRTVGRGLDIAEARVDADLTAAELRVPGVAWVKPEGQPASAAFSVRRDRARLIVIEDAEIDAEGLEFAGDFRVSEDGRLHSADIRRLAVGGAFDLSAEVSRTADDGLAIAIDADYVDARGVLPQLIQLAGGGGDAAAAAAAAPDVEPEPDPERGARRRDAPIFLTARLARALISDEIALDDMSLVLDHNGQRARGLEFEATGPSGVLSAEIVSTAEGARRLRASAPDAGGLMRAVFGYDELEGGAVEVEGDLPALSAPGESAAEVVLRIRDFRLRRAPVFAQILSLGSLRGLADTLAGGGIAFDVLEAPMTVTDGRFTLHEARAAGGSLGITVTGDVDLAGRALDIEGVLVPAYAVNSILGAVPILGDVLVSRRGEGVFALRYSISGPFDEMEVFVNALSALTPGFLRRVFEGASAPQAELPAGPRRN